MDVIGSTACSGKVGKGASEAVKRRREADKLRELEALVAAKAKQFATLARRNAELRFKERILSDVVQLSDYLLRIATTGAHLPPPDLYPPEAVPGSTLGSGAQPWLGSISMAETVRMPGSARFLLAPELLPPVNPERLRSIGRQQLLETWKATLAECSALLLALETNPADEAAAGQMRKCLGEASFLFRHASASTPSTVLLAQQMHLETADAAAPPLGHWHRVLAALELTPTQMADLRAAYSIYISIMASVLADRRAIKVQMSEGLQPRIADPRVTPAAMLLSPECKVLPALERNMRKESAAHILLCAFMYGRTLSVLQVCRAAVHSYPFFPDMTSLAAAAAGAAE